MKFTRRSLLTTLILTIFVPLSVLIIQTHTVKGAPLTLHPPIFIDGDKSFNSSNGIVSGNGTLLNPYLIQNWNITSSSGTAIDVRNTTAYFVIRNVFVGRSQYGMLLHNVTNADIENSTLFKNQYGVYLVSSSDALIFNNNFINNTVLQAYDINGILNSWDNGYYSPSGGGNYWSDYTGVDKCGGPYETVCPGPDGIGDTPYHIGPSLTYDYYPLMKPYIPDNTPPIWPAGSKLTGSRLTPTSITLNWTIATDDVGVVSYVVFEGSIKTANVTANIRALNVTGLTPGTTYTFKVEATDRANNLSNDGPRLTITTPKQPPWFLSQDFWLRNLYLIVLGAAAVGTIVITVILRRRSLARHVPPSKPTSRSPVPK